LKSADGFVVSVARLNWVGPDEVWFQRSSKAQPWRQLKALLGEELKPLILKEQEAKQDSVDAVPALQLRLLSIEGGKQERFQERKRPQL
jgi:hypothetical protein